MTTEAIATKEETLPTTTTFNIDLDDIEIPSIRLLQGISEKTNEEGYNAGDYIRSTDDKVLCSKDSSFGIFVLTCEKLVTHERHTGSKWEWAGTEKFNPQTFTYDEYEVEGEKRRDKKTFTYTVLLSEDVENEVKGESQGLMPAKFQLKSTALRTAKKINTRLMNNQRAGYDPAAIVLEIGSKQEKNDLGTYFVPTLKEGRKATDEELGIVQKWRELVSQKGDDQEDAPF